MEIIITILTVILVILAVYLILIAPGRPRSVKRFAKVKYAHRGLHNEKRAENSMSAFCAAVEAGYGIELDVRLSRDGELVVFHDDTLSRVTGVEGKVIDFTYDELSKIHLSGTEDTVPRFLDVLALVDGRVPLLVEIKEDAGDSAVSTKTAEILSEYQGDYIVESFNPLSLGNIKKRMPGVTAGLLSHRYMEYEQYKKPLYFLLQTLLLNRLCSPAFIAYDHRHASCLSLRILRRLFGCTTFAWTVRSEEEHERAIKNGFDSIIFEGFLPKEEK